METSKIQLDISEDKIVILDRMPINWSHILFFLVVNFSFLTFFLHTSGIIISVFFSVGYILFRYFAFILWKKIEINLKKSKMTVINMFLNTEGASKIITENFEFSKLKLNKFEQSGMKRAIIQYESTKSIDLLLLTHIDDILIIENELMKKCLTSPAHHNF